MSIRERVSRPTYEKFGEPEPIEPLFSNAQTHSLEAWRLLREQVDNRWQRVLGMPSFGGYDPTPSLLYTFDQPAYRATVYQQPTGPSTRQTLLLMEPNRPLPAPLPGMVIPFYTPDRMVGLDISTREPLVGESPLIQFARHLAEQGYLVVCTEAFPYNTVSEPEENVGFAWWQKGAEKLLLDHPDWTGMGKLVYDTRRALALLLAQPTVDPSRVGVMGHSLGGKMSFYAGCLDERFHAVISSDFGMGWSFTNWDAPWYLGKQIKEPGFTLAHHHLLALAAPRPFLLFGGEADRPATWQYLEEARKVYSLYGQSSAIGFFDHGAGHRPTEESLEVAYGWLAEHFGVNPNPWSL